MISLGLEQFLRQPPASVRGARLGLLTNQASVDRHLLHGRILIDRNFPGQLRTLFSPQHGFYSEKQDNMIESDHATDPATGRPVYSLYGKVRKPTEVMFDDIDVLLVDLVDVGTRVYTFLYTMAYCLEKAKQCGKKVVILDRPNPIGGERVEGNLLETEYASFVGLYPLPMRHGMTMGELACYINSEFSIGAELTVVPMDGWTRDMYYQDTGLPWVFPSPNMPLCETAIVYPGQVIWEGTNVSEGRGTTRPFELFGAPYINLNAVMQYLRDKDLPGCFFRPLCFQPTSGKWAGRVCNGFQLHVTGRDFKPYRTSLTLLQAFFALFPEFFEYKAPPYEYEYVKLPMDMILGSRTLRERIEAGWDIVEMERDWQSDLKGFMQRRAPYLLYS